MVLELESRRKATFRTDTKAAQTGTAENALGSELKAAHVLKKSQNTLTRLTERTNLTT
jgi:hypothetical protein